MGLFKDVLEGVVGGFTLAAVEHSNRLHGGSGKLDRLCQEAGWPIDERTADGVVLYFNDPIVRIRKISVTEGTKIILLSALSAATMPASRLPAEIMGYLLTRNMQLLCAWQAPVMNNQGNVAFALTYGALVDGLDAATFKVICESMVREVYDFDAKLRQAGLL